MKLTENKSHAYKWHYGSIRIVILVLYFTTLCSISSAENLVFTIRNIHCGKYVHPKSAAPPNWDPIHLWDGKPSYIRFIFDQYSGKYGHIRHVDSGKLWGLVRSKIERGGDIELWPSSYKRWSNLFVIDPANGWIQHSSGYYVHFSGTMCSNGARLQLWDGGHERARWEIVYEIPFAIQNKHCGKYIHPKTPSSFPNWDPIQLWDGAPSYINFVFDQYEGIWGHIRHVDSSKLWGLVRSKVEKDSDIELWPSTYKWQTNLFAIDQVNGWIKHKSGLYVHYESRKCDRGDRIHLWDSKHDRMTWRFVNSKNGKEVLPYGTVKVNGDWQLVFAIHNPRAEHIYKVEYKQGRSLSKSTTHQLTFKWQIEAAATIDIFKLSSTRSLEYQVSHTSASTWYSEKKESHAVTVKAGVPVAVWQYVYIGEQLGSKEFFQSDIFEHTASADTKPKSSLRKRSTSYSRVRSNKSKFWQQNQDNISITLRNDESSPHSNATEDIDYDENGVFSIYSYEILDDAETKKDDYSYQIVDDAETKKDDYSYKTVDDAEAKKDDYSYETLDDVEIKKDY